MESNLLRTPRVLSATSLLKLCLRSFYVLGLSVTEMILAHPFIGFNEHKPAENTSRLTTGLSEMRLLLVCHHSNVSASTEHKGAEAAIRADPRTQYSHQLCIIRIQPQQICRIGDNSSDSHKNNKRAPPARERECFVGLLISLGSARTFNGYILSSNCYECIHDIHHTGCSIFSGCCKWLWMCCGFH